MSPKSHKIYFFNNVRIGSLWICPIILYLQLCQTIATFLQQMLDSFVAFNPWRLVEHAWLSLVYCAVGHTVYWFFSEHSSFSNLAVDKFEILEEWSNIDFYGCVRDAVS